MSNTNTGSPKSFSPESTPAPSRKPTPLLFRTVEVLPVLGVQELDYCCPFCGTDTRGLEELVFTEDQIFYKGRALHFGGRVERQVFAFLFKRRGRLVQFSDLHDRFEVSSIDPYYITRTVMRRLRSALAREQVPISIRNVRGEGYVMNVNARETP